jgi:hypothetical protein
MFQKTEKKDVKIKSKAKAKKYAAKTGLTGAGAVKTELADAGKKSIVVIPNSKFDIKKLNLVLQKEYLIIKPDDKHPILATESIRGCYAVLLYHPEKSAILHWDDNTRRSEIDKFVKEFLGENVTLEECAIHLIGGWKDNKESQKSGEVLRSYFSKCKVNLDYYQVKKSTGVYSQQGFSAVGLDSRTGAVLVRDNWTKAPLGASKYQGQDAATRLQNLNLLFVTHLQDDQYPDSGSVIIPRDNFFNLQFVQANQLCVAAQKNQIDLLIKYIDDGITNVNVSPTNAKGWTPLHYACKFGNFAIARLLINNGANLYQPNDAGKSPLDLVPSDKPFTSRQLIDAYRLVQKYIAADGDALITFSQFSRHPERISPEIRNQFSKLNELLDDEKGLNVLEKSLECKG